VKLYAYDTSVPEVRTRKAVLTFTLCDFLACIRTNLHFYSNELFIVLLILCLNVTQWGNTCEILELLDSKLCVFFSFFFHSCTLHSDIIQSFISPTSAQPICFKILQFTLLGGTYISRPNRQNYVPTITVNFNILKQIGCALVGLINDWILYVVFVK